MNKDVSQLEFSALGRQQADLLLSTRTPLTANEVRPLNSRLVRGYGAIEIFIISSSEMEVRVGQGCTFDGQFETEFTFTSKAVGGRFVLSERFATTSPYMEIVIEEKDGVDQTLMELCVTGLPVGSVPDSNNGTGSPGGPGNVIVTKVDLLIPPAAETPALLAADIPVGTRRVTIQNVGSNPVRMKATGEGGGAGRGIQLVANQSMTIGDVGGSIATLDAFSTLGTTLAFFFERN